MSINIKQGYKKKVLNICSKYYSISLINEPGFEYRKSTLLPEYISDYSLLFVGINPSFTKKDRIHIGNQDIECYMINKQVKNIAYYTKFKDISTL